MTLTDTIAAPYKVDLQVAQYENGRTPADGPPDRIVSVTTWHEADGEPVTDESRIAELEGSIARTEKP